MLGKLRFAKRLFRDLPLYSKLAYCLLRDDRVSAAHKAAFGATLAVGLNPFINLPEFIPVVGELDALAVSLLALRVFIATAPGYVVDEHRQLLIEERSVFDRDLRSGEGRLVQFTDTLSRRFRPEPDGYKETIEVQANPAPTNEKDVNA